MNHRNFKKRFHDQKEIYVNPFIGCLKTALSILDRFTKINTNITKEISFVEKESSELPNPVCS